MMIIGQPLDHIRLEPVERIQPGRLANPHFLLPSQIRPHCLTVAACVAGNGRDRPSPLLQRMNLHIFLRCQHPGWLLSVSLVVADSKPGGEPPSSPVSRDWRVGNISQQVWGELRERGQGLTIADLEQARHGTPTTVAADLDEALAAMTPSTRERYAPFLRVLCDGLPEVCWCLCERCSGYVTSTCPCRKTAAAGRAPKSPSWSS